MSSLPQCIAICSVGEIFGGVERHILGMVEGLQMRSIKVILLLFYDAELAAQSRHQGVEPVILQDSNWSLFSTARKIAYILKRQQIQLVHVHGYKAVVFCALARHWYPFEMVKTEHGLPESTGGELKRRILDRLYYSLDNLAIRTAKATVCYVTKELATYYIRVHSGLPSAIIPNGIANIDRARLSCPPELCADWFNLVLVGRIDMVKGHSLAIAALATNDIPSDLHLHIVGVGPGEQDLKILVESLGLSSRIHFLGFRRNVYDYIAHCQVLLMPSLHEGLPYTLLEAMALGVPIVASCVGGLAEVLQDEVTALLVPPKDVNALAAAIRRLYHTPELRSQIGNHAQRIQQTRYSLEAMIEGYLAVYGKSLMQH